MKPESLHNHTTASDGHLNHLELLVAAAKYGYGVVALTDHDTLPDAETLSGLKLYNGPVKWLVGVEVSAGWPRELGGGAAGLFHILGLFVDPFDRELLEHCRKAGEARIERMETMVANLVRIGLKISVNDCLRQSGGESVGRPHVVAALMSHETNFEVIEKLRGDMEKAAQNDELMAKRYGQMMQWREASGDVSQLFYGLVLSDDAFVAGVYVDYKYFVDMDESVRLIRAAGGVAVLAHWPTVKERLGLDLLEQFLVDGRLDGVELATGYESAETDAERRQLTELAERVSCLTTIGVDTHEEVNLAKFAAKAELARLTVGQTERLIERVKPDLSWSNLK